MTNIQNIITELKSPQKTVEINSKHFQKMVFITNAIDDGWSVKKVKDNYIFSKKHENKKEVFDDFAKPLPVAPPAAKDAEKKSLAKIPSDFLVRSF